MVKQRKKDLTNPKVDDLLDDMGELVIKMGGEVMVMPKTRCPPIRVLPQYIDISSTGFKTKEISLTTGNLFFS